MAHACRPFTPLLLQPWLYLFLEALFIGVFCIGAWAAMRFITHIKR